MNRHMWVGGWGGAGRDGGGGGTAKFTCSMSPKYRLKYNDRFHIKKSQADVHIYYNTTI